MDDEIDIRLPEEQEFKATVGEYKDFLNSNVWVDMKEEVERRIEITVKALELGTASTLDEIRYHQGCLYELRWLVDFPSNTVQIMNEIKKVEGEKDEE